MGLKNKDLILELLEKDFINNGDGLTTVDIAKQLYMQRTNVSKLLNELVVEKLVVKNENNRPVFYKRNKDTFNRILDNPFEQLIGAGKSLKKAIHLAKAAVMYPNKGLNALIIGERGTGKGFFAKKMYEYALEARTINKDAKLISLNCLDFLNDEERLYCGFRDALQKAEDSYLLIDNVQYIDNMSRSVLLPLLSNGFHEESGERKNSKTVIICTLGGDSGSDEFLNVLKGRFAITVELPPLTKMTVKERLELIELFLQQEAIDSGCTFKFNSEIIISLLLYNCSGNIKELKNDIKQACASAYAREYAKNDGLINLMILDFSPNVRTGLLNYRVMKNEVDSVINSEVEYIIDKDRASVVNIKKIKNSIYDWINNKSAELKKRGLSSNEINTIVNVGIENEFKKYRSNKINYVVNKEQLLQIVEEKIIILVEKFINNASQKLNRFYSSSIYYGLCLHLQSLVDGRGKPSNVKIQEIMSFVDNNRVEYSLAADFCDQFSSEYDISMSIDETVLVAMFLLDQKIKQEITDHPSVLLAMHGDSVAKSLAETISVFNNAPVYYFDLPLNKKPLDAYDDIKKTLLNLPHDRGIMVFYDMGSFKDIFNMISIETGISLKVIQLPFTLIMLDCCRKIMVSESINDAYDKITERLMNTKIMGEELNSQIEKSKVIVSVCLTGEGGAYQIKNYLEKNYELNNVEVVALQVNRNNDFILELNRLSKEKEIMCIIGTFNPNVYGIPFIPIEQVFSPDNKDITNLLERENIDNQNFVNNSEIIFKHLMNELTNVDINEVKNMCIDTIRNIEKEYGKSIDINEKIGLVVHLACAISRLKAGAKSYVNPYESEIIEKNMMLYRIIEKYASNIETKFNISFNKSEIANVVSIIKKSKTG